VCRPRRRVSLLTSYTVAAVGVALTVVRWGLIAEVAWFAVIGIWLLRSHPSAQREPGWVLPAITAGLLSGFVVIMLVATQIVLVPAIVIERGRPKPFVMVLLCVVLAGANAVIEETIWRAGFARVGRLVLGARPVGVGVIQAVGFGLAHFHGIPGGAVGVVAASFFGGLMWVIATRWRWTAALVAHGCTDLVIFLYVASRRVQYSPSFRFQALAPFVHTAVSRYLVI